MKKYEKIFVVRGVEKKSGDYVYYAIDSNSGGYPYWSSGVANCKFFYGKAPDFASENGGCDYMFDQVTKVSILQLEFTSVEEIPVENIEEYKKKKKREEILEKIQELNRQYKEI